MPILPPIDNLAIRAASYRVRCELRVLAEVLSDPTRAVPFALRWGCRAALFDMPDHQIIWSAAEISVEHKRTDQQLVDLCRLALKADHLWADDARAFSRGMQWSYASLWALCFEAEQPRDGAALNAAVRDAVNELARVSRLMRDAQRHYQSAQRALEAAGDRPYPSKWDLNRTETTRRDVRRRATAAVA